jgi:hypothetical protein
MAQREYVRKANDVLEHLVKWTAYVGAAVSAVGYVLSFVRWDQKGPFPSLVARLPILWAATASASIVLLWVWVARLRSRFTTGFVDDFS